MSNLKEIILNQGEEIDKIKENVISFNKKQTRILNDFTRNVLFVLDALGKQNGSSQFLIDDEFEKHFEDISADIKEDISSLENDVEKENFSEDVSIDHQQKNRLEMNLEPRILSENDDIYGISSPSEVEVSVDDYLDNSEISDNISVEADNKKEFITEDTKSYSIVEDINSQSRYKIFKNGKIVTDKIFGNLSFSTKYKADECLEILKDFDSYILTKISEEKLPEHFGNKILIKYSILNDKGENNQFKKNGFVEIEPSEDLNDYKLDILLKSNLEDCRNLTQFLAKNFEFNRETYGYKKNITKEAISQKEFNEKDVSDFCDDIAKYKLNRDSMIIKDFSSADPGDEVISVDNEIITTFNKYSDDIKGEK